MNRVIAVAGAVGAGKSTLVRALAARLADSTSIQFDHFERMTERPIEDVRLWIQEGADVDKLPVPGLAEALDALKLGRAVVDPLTGAEIPAAKHILLETQFGRRHKATGRHIDFLIWIDTPLDIALARKVRQFVNDLDPGDLAGAASFARWLADYLENYVEVVGGLLRMQRETVAAQADLVVDGASGPDEQARVVERAILGKHE
jgi:uridine kinase